MNCRKYQFAALLLPIPLMGCSVLPQETYWFYDPVIAGEVRHELVVPQAVVNQKCGEKSPKAVALGCWIQEQGTILISSDITLAEQACVRSHERTHAAGYNHPADWVLQRVDCGFSF